MTHKYIILWYLFITIINIKLLFFLLLLAVEHKIYFYIYILHLSNLKLKVKKII